MLSQSYGQVLNDEWSWFRTADSFSTREENTLDLILTAIPGQFQDMPSPDKLSDHDIVARTLKILIPPKKKPRQKVYLYQKGDYGSMRKDALNFAIEKYFNGHSNSRSVQKDFDLIASFIQEAADKHIPSKLADLQAQFLGLHLG